MTRYVASGTALRKGDSRRDIASGAALVKTTGASTQALTPSLFTNTNTFFAPTISRGAVALTPSLLTNTNSFFAPTIGRGVVTLTPSLLTNTNTFFAPAVSQPSGTTNYYLLLALTSSASGAAAQNLTPSLLTNTNQFFAPTISGGSSATFSQYGRRSAWTYKTKAPETRPENKPEIIISRRKGKSPDLARLKRPVLESLVQDTIADLSATPELKKALKARVKKISTAELIAAAEAARQAQNRADEEALIFILLVA